MSRYLRLLGLALAAAVVLGIVARLPHPRPHATTPPAADTAPALALDLVVRDGVLTPGVASVPKGRRVALTVTNRGARATRLALSGYEDRLAIGDIAPGSTLRAGFTADLPGEDFAWLLDGRPAGRFQVLGSHLVEGHR